MAANMKLSKAELAKRAAAQNDQTNDFLSQLGSLGNPVKNEAPVVEPEVSNKSVTNIEETEQEEEIPVKVRTVNKTVTAKPSSTKTEKPGYISLVITPSLKKKWKSYCTEHGLSLTDCIKISMRLLEDLEKKNTISLEDGVLSYLS